MDKVFLIVNKKKENGHGDSWPVIQLAKMSIYEEIVCPSFKSRESAAGYLDFFRKHIIGECEIMELIIYPEYVSQMPNEKA